MILAYDRCSIGPHFSYTFYNTTSSLVQSVFGLVGVMIFQTVLSKWRFRTVFWVRFMVCARGAMMRMVACTGAD